MPTKQKDCYSCGFWVAKMMIQIVMDKRPLAEVSVDVDAPEYRKFVTRLIRTRYIYIDGVYPKPTAMSTTAAVATSLTSLPKKNDKEEEKLQPIACTFASDEPMPQMVASLASAPFMAANTHAAPAMDFQAMMALFRQQ